MTPRPSHRLRSLRTASPPARLRPGLVLLRRDRTTWQIGADPAHAVLVRNVDDATARGLQSLAGPPGGGDADLGPTLLAQLAAHHLLANHATASPGRVSLVRRRARHRGERDTAELVGTPDPIPGRERARVAVAGCGLVAALVASGLAHAGVGTVAVLGPRRPVIATDLAPGGPTAADLGTPWADAVATVVRALGARTTLVDGAPADMAVLTQAVDADLPWCDPEHGDPWLRSGTAHLAVGVAGWTGEVGPVVLPGRTACLRCRDLARVDADPRWPIVALGLRAAVAADRGPARAVSTPLALVTAALTVARVLAYVDGDHGEHVDDGDQPGSGRVDGLRVGLPGTVVGTFAVARHPLCGCGWAEALSGPRNH